MIHRLHLLPATALPLLAAHPAVAQTTTVPAPTPAAAATPASAAVNMVPDSGQDMGEIVVLGRGETRQVQEVSAADIKLFAAGSSPIRTIEKLPGVNFQSADPFGNYEWAVRISIRGFNQNQLGFNLDGIPLGDMSYGNYNGLHISRAISPENLATTRVTQGAGAVATNSTNNLGGTIEFVSRDPSETRAVEVALTGGSSNSFRGFVRYDSGDIAGTGIRGYVSYAYLGLDKWKGAGEQRQHVVNAKLVVPLGEARLTGFFDFSDRRENDYQDLSLGVIDRLGYDVDNISNNFPLALRIAQVGANRGDTGATPTNPAAGTVYPAPYQTVDDVYYDAGGLRQDYLGGLRLDAPIAENLKLSLTGYYHSNNGQGLWWTPYVPGTNGLQISVRTTEYGISRGGLFGHLEWTVGPNRLRAGGWYESNSFRQARRFYNVDDPDRIDGRDHLVYQRNPFFTQWDLRFGTDTTQVFVEDRLELGDLTVNAGFKGFQVINRARPEVQGGLAVGRITATDWFQPSIGATWKFGFGGEVFANYSEATRAFPSAATAGPFATTVAGFQALDIRPETSKTYEAGLRYQGHGLQASLVGYVVDFNNRLLSFRNGAGIQGNPAILSNVGSVSSHGIELAAQYRLTRAIRLFASYAYNRSTYDNDVLRADGQVQSRIAGRTVVDSPENILNGEIAYDDGSVFGRFGFNYQSQRFFTYTNDQSVPGRTVADASIGYRFQGPDWLKGTELQLSATNLFNERYVATIGSNGYGDAGDNQTLLAGAPQQFFVTVRRTL